MTLVRRRFCDLDQPIELFTQALLKWPVAQFVDRFGELETDADDLDTYEGFGFYLLDQQPIELHQLGQQRVQLNTRVPFMLVERRHSPKKGNAELWLPIEAPKHVMYGWVDTILIDLGLTRNDLSWLRE